MFHNHSVINLTFYLWNLQEQLILKKWILKLCLTSNQPKQEHTTTPEAIPKLTLQTLNIVTNQFMTLLILTLTKLKLTFLNSWKMMNNISISEMSTPHLIIETVLALACVYFFILFIKSIISTVKDIIQILKQINHD